MFSIAIGDVIGGVIIGGLISKFSQKTALSADEAALLAKLKDIQANPDKYADSVIKISIE